MCQGCIMNFKIHRAYVEMKKAQAGNVLIIKVKDLAEVKKILDKKINVKDVDEIRFVDYDGNFISSLDVREFVKIKKA